MTLSTEVMVYLEYCRFRKELDEKTLKAYRIDLRQYIEACGDAAADRKRMERYVTELHKKFKQKTVKRKIASIKAFYNYLEEMDLIAETPFRKIKVKFKETVLLPRIIPREDIERFLNGIYACLGKERASQEKFVLRDICVVEMLFATGARVYEISNIRMDCVSLDSGRIRIMGKGGKERYVQIVEEDVLKLLRRYYQANEDAIQKSGYFFVNQRGERFTEQSVRLMLQKYAKQAGIEKPITPHMFRHSLATYLIEEGADVSCIQQILGHSSIKTTQIYIHVAAKTQADVLKNYHPRKRMNISGVA